jgi:hypothetical protein
MKILSLFVVVLVATTTGCTSLSQPTKDEQKIPITIYEGKSDLQEAGAVYLWPPFSSAAIVDGKGNRCVLAANGAKTIDASTEAALKIGKAFDKIEGLDAATKSHILETFTKLSAADAHAAFADVALFHLCIMDENGTFAEYKVNKKTGEKTDHTFKAKLMMDAYLEVVRTAQDFGGK